MGELFLIEKSFELAQVDEVKRDLLFFNFCAAIENVIKSKDSLYAVETIHTTSFSYGNFFYDFLLKSWPEIVQNPNLKGISNNTHSLFISILYSIPNIVNRIESIDSFVEEFENSHIGYCGFEIVVAETPYIFSLDTWQNWKYNWLINNQKEIVWNDSDVFLLNKEYSNSLLWEEVIKHGKQDELKKYDGNKVLTFHKEVMMKKGSEIEGYTIEIGTKIASANYYIYDRELSLRERRAAGNSLRTIFRILCPEKKYKFISLDHKHGMFEFHDDKGVHLGEFHFDGSYNSNPDSSHNLKTV